MHGHQNIIADIENDDQSIIDDKEYHQLHRVSPMIDLDPESFFKIMKLNNFAE